MTVDTSDRTDAPNHDAALADAERRAESLAAELRAAIRAQEHEREQKEAAARERDALRAELTEARKRLDAETAAHAKSRQAHDLHKGKVSGLEAEVAEARREATRQHERADSLAKDLATVRRDLIDEQSAHRAAKERAAGHEKAAQDLAAAQAQAQRQEAEATALRERLAVEQAAVIELQARVEALTKEVDIAGERAAGAKRMLADETATHAVTRQRLEEAREALRQSERRRQRQTVASVLGGAAIGLAALLRRRA